MPLVPVDALWSPLFETAEIRRVDQPVEVTDTGEVHAPLSDQEPPGLKTACWKAPASYKFPLAVPPPWKGEVTVKVPAGCRRLLVQTSEETRAFESLVLASKDMSFDASLWLDGKRTWHGLYQHKLPYDPDGTQLVLSQDEPEIVLERDLIKLEEIPLLLGDVLPYTRGELQGWYPHFMGKLALDPLTLAKRTGQGPYAGAAFELAIGYSTAGSARDRARVHEAMLLLDPAQLSPAQRQTLPYLIEALAGYPSDAAPAGTATLVVDNLTLEVEVAGKLVLAREKQAQMDAYRQGRGAPEELKIEVPAGEAVFVRTRRLRFYANEGGWFMEDSAFGWAGLVPGERYVLESGRLKQTATPGTFCIYAEGVPEDLQSQSYHDDWNKGHAFEVKGLQVPRPYSRVPGQTKVNLWIVEPGHYVAVYEPGRPIRVRFAPKACLPPLPPQSAPPAEPEPG